MLPSLKEVLFRIWSSYYKTLQVFTGDTVHSKHVYVIAVDSAQPLLDMYVCVCMKCSNTACLHCEPFYEIYKAMLAL